MRKIEVEAEDLRRMLMLLDAADDALTAAAKAEERRERGKRMRSITDQQRAKHTREFVTEMTDKYGV